jgi:hypothetical protein
MNGSITLDYILVNLLVGGLIPIAVQLIARSHAPTNVKALINLVLATVAGVITPYITLAHVPWQSIFISIGQILLTSIVSYIGVLKPTGIAGSQGVIAQKVPGGIGTAQPPPVQIGPPMIVGPVPTATTYGTGAAPMTDTQPVPPAE